MVDKRAYACSGYINGRVCKNDRYVRRDKLETTLLADIRAGLLEPGTVERIERLVRARMRSLRRDDSAARITRLEIKVNNMVAAIGQGMLSPTLRQRLQQAESELERLRSAPKPAAVDDLLPHLPRLIRRQVDGIDKLAAVEPVRARDAVRESLETDLITIRPAEAGRGVVAEYGLLPVQLKTGTAPESVVAGARFQISESLESRSESS